MKLTLIVVALAAALAAGWHYTQREKQGANPIDPAALFDVARGELKITVTENGYLKAKNSVNLKPKFRRQGTITWLIEEGETVEEGDVLIEFDKTELNNQISELETSLIQYEMELEAGQADLQIQERENTAVVEKAELARELAELKLERYEKGEAPNERHKMQLAEEKARSEFERAEERFKQVPDLEREGFLTKIQVEEERIRLREAEINKENALRDLELFETYTHRMDLTQRKSDLKDATRELETARIKAEISLKEKQARATQQERKVASTKARIAQLKEELEHMTLRATQPGLVHYGDPARPWARDQIKVGNTLHQGNTAITLPDLTVMQVLVQVHEGEIDIVEEGMPVLVTVETHKGLTFPGKITEIATVASSRGWNDETNKSFRVEITMDAAEAELRAGVTAKAEIQVKVLADVLYVPIHAIFPEDGKHYCFVYTGERVERRRITTGDNNASYVAIADGLEAGEQVLLYDPENAARTSTDEDEDESSPAEGLASGLAGMGSSSP